MVCNPFMFPSPSLNKYSTIGSVEAASRFHFRHNSNAAKLQARWKGALSEDAQILIFRYVLDSGPLPHRHGITSDVRSLFAPLALPAPAPGKRNDIAHSYSTAAGRGKASVVFSCVPRTQRQHFLSCAHSLKMRKGANQDSINSLFVVLADTP